MSATDLATKLAWRGIASGVVMKVVAVGGYAGGVVQSIGVPVDPTRFPFLNARFLNRRDSEVENTKVRTRNKRGSFIVVLCLVACVFCERNFLAFFSFWREFSMLFYFWWSTLYGSSLETS